MAGSPNFFHKTLLTRQKGFVFFSLFPAHGRVMARVLPILGWTATNNFFSVRLTAQKRGNININVFIFIAHPHSQHIALIA